MFRTKICIKCINMYQFVVIATSLLKSATYSKQLSNNIKTGKEMKFDVGTQSFVQNTFIIFSLTLFNVLTLKIVV